MDEIPPKRPRGRPPSEPAVSRRPRNRIKELRAINDDMTQETLAALLGVDTATVSKWEVGKTDLTVERIFQLADIFQCHPRDLLPGPAAPFRLTPRDIDRIERFHGLSEPEQRILDRGLGLPDRGGGEAP